MTVARVEVRRPSAGLTSRGWAAAAVVFRPFSHVRAASSQRGVAYMRPLTFRATSRSIPRMKVVNSPVTWFVRIDRCRLTRTPYR
jgi:hypothetical protein